MVQDVPGIMRSETVLQMNAVFEEWSHYRQKGVAFHDIVFAW